MRRTLCGLTGMLMACAPALAQEAQPMDLGLYGVLGSGGWGLGLNRPLTPAWGLRAELAQASLTDTYTQDQIRYRGKVKLRGNGVFADYRPFDGSFRLVLGATLGRTGGELLGEPSNGQITLNGQTFNATGNSLHASIQYPSSMPYLGLGWGHGRPKARGWTFGLDLGVGVGKPKVRLTGSGDLLTQPGAADALAAEERKMQDDLNGIGVLPVLKFSAGYQF
jgi:hypothetical protein